MDKKFVWMIERQRFAELLDGPFGGGVGRDAGVQNPARTDFHGDEDVEHFEVERDRLEEVASYDGLGMGLDERGPSLATITTTRSVIAEVLADRSRRNANAELQLEFIGDALFTPSWIFAGHPSDERADVFWKLRSASATTLPLPEFAERRPVPPQEGFGFHYDQS